MTRLKKTVIGNVKSFKFKALGNCLHLKKSALASAALLCFASPGWTADSGVLIVDISGCHNDAGLVRLGIFDDARKFDDPNDTGAGALKNVTAPISSGRAHFEIADLKYGNYAIKFFHDEDQSNKFYKNMLGMPKVEYGFSNNARALLAPAKYKQAQFAFDSPKTKLALKAAK